MEPPPQPPAPHHAAAPPSEVVELSPDLRFGRFAKLLGEGSVKRVFEAIDKDRGSLVAWN